MFAERFVVTVKHPASSEQVLVPLVLDKNLTDAMAAYHGELEETLNSSTRNRQLIDSMNRKNGGTEALMIVLLLLAQSLLVGSIAFAAWRASQDET